MFRSPSYFLLKLAKFIISHLFLSKWPPCSKVLFPLWWSLSSAETQGAPWPGKSQTGAHSGRGGPSSSSISATEEQTCRNGLGSSGARPSAWLRWSVPMTQQQCPTYYTMSPAARLSFLAVLMARAGQPMPISGPRGEGSTGPRGWRRYFPFLSQNTGWWICQNKKKLYRTPLSFTSTVPKSAYLEGMRSPQRAGAIAAAVLKCVVSPTVQALSMDRASKCRYRCTFRPPSSLRSLTNRWQDMLWE